MEDGRLTAEERQILDEYDKGVLLEQLTALPGWKVVLDIIEERVAQTEFQLINYNGSDADIVLALQRRARAFRELFQLLQQDVVRLIDASKNLPNILEARRQTMPWDVT